MKTITFNRLRGVYDSVLDGTGKSGYCSSYWNVAWLCDVTREIREFFDL